MSILNKINDAFNMDYYSLKDVFVDGEMTYNKIHNSNNNSSNGDIVEFGNYQREYIETGFGRWRAVIKKFNQTSIYKLICVHIDKDTNINTVMVFLDVEEAWTKGILLVVANKNMNCFCLTYKMIFMKKTILLLIMQKERLFNICINCCLKNFVVATR